MDDTQNILDRLTKLEGKSIQVDLQPTERENLKNNLFEGFGTPTSSDAKVYLDVIWKEKHYFVPTGMRTAYTGQVMFDGSTGNLPTGWTATKNSTGTYTITHNLGNSAYNAVATISNGEGGKFIVIGDSGNKANTILIYTLTDATTKADSSFNFILTLY